jgi:2-dehydro-3-deoxy-D-arabinonate dehydratase
MALWRIIIQGQVRLALGPADGEPQHLMAPEVTLAHLLGGQRAGNETLTGLAAAEPLSDTVVTMAPTDEQPIWAAGVTFERSRKARKEEAVSSDFYDRVYEADRPELFLKALPGQARGPGSPIGIRADSTWDVPEPELAVVADHRGRIVGYVLGNDVSSRSIEGENPLYLPQAKVYEGSCALGPCMVPLPEAPVFEEIEMVLTIHRARRVLYKDSVHLSQMRRSPQELVEWLFGAQQFPHGVVLMTGTSIVPDPELTLKAGDEVTVAATGLGALVNTVEVVGRSRGIGR